MQYNTNVFRLSIAGRATLPICRTDSSVTVSTQHSAEHQLTEARCEAQCRPRRRGPPPIRQRSCASAPPKILTAVVSWCRSTLAFRPSPPHSRPAQSHGPHGRPTQLHPGPARRGHHHQPHGTVTVTPAKRQRRNADGTAGPTTPPRLSAATSISMLACYPAAAFPFTHPLLSSSGDRHRRRRPPPTPDSTTPAATAAESGGAVVQSNPNSRAPHYSGLWSPCPSLCC